nr:MAG TPA: YopX protein [Caudoviricetes sp.]
MLPKFRGRNIETGEWVYGHLFYFNDGRHFISPTGTDVFGGYGGAPAKYRLENLVCFEIKPETVGQFTGLKDKNGVEIFEGDVIGSQNKDRSNWYVSHHKIVWHDTGFVGKQICSRSFIGLEHWTRGENGYVVIGNIYENPELLEQADES